MAEIIKRNKPLVVSPLKTSQPLGASLAVLGLNRALPLMHGAQGCTAFAKVLLVRHFREPIPLQTTALDSISSIMGAEDSLLAGLCTVCEKHRPAAVGLLTTGLTETQGTDIARGLKLFRDRYPEFRAVGILPINTPDFTGGLESGFAAAVETMIEEWVPAAAVVGTHPGRRPRQINVLCGSALTPGDLEALRETIERFGLHPLLVPDLAESLDGHLSAEDFSPLTTGGTPLSAFATLGDAAATLVIGDSLHAAAALLHERTGVPTHTLPHLFGLAANDHLVMTLAGIAGQPVPTPLARQRAQLLDTMLDTHFLLGQARVAIAAEADLLHGFSQLLAELGADVVAAVTPTPASNLARIPVPQIHIGDLEDLETLAGESNAELLIGNSHAVEVAQRLELPLLRAGLPLYDQFGGYQRTWIGYRGARQALFDLANALLAQADHAVAPYPSFYSRKADSPQETRHGATPASAHSDWRH